MNPNDPLFRVFLDFDGTLVGPNVAIVLVEKFARDGARVAHEVDEELHAGIITLRQAWERQAALLPADRIDEMTQWVVDEIPLRPGAHELLGLLKEERYPVVVLSGGIDFYISAVLKREGLDLPFFSDSFEKDSAGQLHVVHPYGHATCRQCGICKAQVVRSELPQARRTMFIGDGSTDKFAAEVADVVFARRRLLQYCRDRQIPVYPFEEFGPVTEQIRLWTSGTEPFPAIRRGGEASSICPISRSLAGATA